MMTKMSIECSTTKTIISSNPYDHHLSCISSSLLSLQIGHIQTSQRVYYIMFQFQDQTQTFTQITLNEKTKEKHVNRSYHMCFLLYFLQGSVLSIGYTMPYMYPELPSYTILAVFSTIDLPFSFKFILSPFLQKYTNFSYGKRKTWVIASQSLCFLILLFSSEYTAVSQASFLALVLMFSQVLITIQDISLDSLSIKQIKCPQKTSIVQSVAVSFGSVLSSLFLLKSTSQEFATKIGLQNPITTPGSMIRIIASFLLLSNILLHYFFKQTQLECEIKGKQKNICQIISYSSQFLNINSRYCRVGILLLIYNQGLNFFQAGYDYEMIHAGFSRDTSNSISNFIAIPVIFLTSKITSLISRYGTVHSLRLILLFLCSLYVFNLVFFSQNPFVVSITQFISQILITSKALVLYILIYTFPTHGFTGMFITFLLSIWNFGQLKTLHTLVISRLGWWGCASIGIAIQLVFIFFLPDLLVWIDKGSIELDQNLMQEKQLQPFETFGTSFVKERLVEQI